MPSRLILAGCLIMNDKREVLLLYRRDHDYYETPGGKVPLDKCKNPKAPSIEELGKSAIREAIEELGSDIKLAEPEYFGKIDFTIPDGREATANKFITRILSGKPRVNEPDIFSKFDYLPLESLDDYPISPDLRLLASKIKKYVKKNKL
jgi:8-oxo-dGTP pyrophosphatase MutT (NUDIX family)